MTLHIRAVSPPGATDALVTAVAAIEGVARLVVLPGAHRPEGDAVQFDVTASAANAVLARLRDLAIPADVQPVDTVLPARPAAPAPRLLARDQPRSGRWLRLISGTTRSMRPAFTCCWSLPG